MRNVKLVPYVLITTLLAATELTVASKPSQNAHAIFEKACAGRLSSSETKKLFEKAAKLDHADARGALALIHLRGWCAAASDTATAVSLAQEAAKQGSGLGNFVLSRAFRDGIVVQRSKERSLSCGRLALKQLATSAAAGNPWTANAMGHIHFAGLAGTPSFDEGMQWMNVAAEKSFEDSLCYLGLVHMTGRPEWKIPSNPLLAKQLFEKAAIKGFADGQFMLGAIYDRGEGGVQKDSSRAVELYQEAADQGHALAQYYVAFYYEFGEGGITKSVTKAVQLYEAAAEQGIAEASFHAARLYDDGWQGHPRSVEKANKYFRIAAELGHAEAAYWMGFMYLKGFNGLEKNMREADRWIQIAMDRNFKESELMYVLFEFRTAARPSGENPGGNLNFGQILQQVTSTQEYRSIVDQYNFDIEQAALSMASLPAYMQQEEFDAFERQARAAAWRKTLNLAKEKAGAVDISAELRNAQVPLFLPSPTF